MSLAIFYGVLDWLPYPRSAADDGGVNQQYISVYAKDCTGKEEVLDFNDSKQLL